MRRDRRRCSERLRKDCRTLRVFLNGEDVTAHTFALDTREGWVLGFAQLPSGGYYMGKDGSLAQRRRHGRVRVVRVRGGQR